ncbi:MAG TPA: phytoene/squalene synthase family protein [Xanthomonadaceae bacterium]|nr:phytoene/squalene synthase family protein [Xanthomonadaceae bacterium]
MNEPAASFVAKWRERWPEWGVAEVFVAPEERLRAVAWFALRQELTDAAWTGGDPRPGEAKLGWWADELLGWTQGRHRHPLAECLADASAPWDLLASCLPSLLASRERAVDADQALVAVEPFAEAVAGVAATLFASRTPAPSRNAALGLLAEQLLVQGEASAPLLVRARLGGEVAAEEFARAWATELLARWPQPHDGARPGRIHAALLHARLQEFAADGRLRPLSRWRSLWTAWRAARR